jgi:hypothetical protein
VGLTWRDLVSSIAVVAMIIVYYAYRVEVRTAIFSGWAAGALLLALSVVCAISAAFDLHTRPQPRGGVLCRRLTTVLGTVGLVAGLLGIFTGSGQALEVLVVATVFLWVTGTLWHVLSIGADE